VVVLDISEVVTVMVEDITDVVAVVVDSDIGVERLGWSKLQGS
jgi:hypothetical protein